MIAGKFFHPQVDTFLLMTEIKIRESEDDMWREYATYTVRDFFELLKQKFRISKL